MRNQVLVYFHCDNLELCMVLLSNMPGSGYGEHRFHYSKGLPNIIIYFNLIFKQNKHILTLETSFSDFFFYS